jgi:uncharacterized protein (DUF983 family)
MKPAAKSDDLPRATLFIKRGLQLRCPECGVSPVFIPAKKVRSMYDWMTPLDGCPRCGYAYLREQGYFLLAIWGVNYGIVAGLGLLICMIFEWLHPLAFWQYVVYIFVPMPILSLLLVRHAKSLFLAMDHFFDPHRSSKRA